MITRTCSTCVHWQAPDKGEVGECHANPPTAQVIMRPTARLGPQGMQEGMQQSMHGVFSPVNRKNWCAKHMHESERTKQ